MKTCIYIYTEYVYIYVYILCHICIYIFYLCVCKYININAFCNLFLHISEKWPHLDSKKWSVFFEGRLLPLWYFYEKKTNEKLKGTCSFKGSISCPKGSNSELISLSPFPNKRVKPIPCVKSKNK